MNFAQEIEIYFRSRFTCIGIVSFEEERMMPGIEAFIGQQIPRKALDGFAYLVPPRLHAYKPPMSSKFRIRRSIPRGGGSRFKR